jgi:tetratricopeptide (TPR) repeat protein
MITSHEERDPAKSAAQSSAHGEPYIRSRVQAALQAGRYEEAIAEADAAIAAMLQHGVAVADFVRLTLAGQRAEHLLQCNPLEIALSPQLREPIALRWEALHRAGRRDEARQMGRLCIELWPERISVWLTAGNHALDDNDGDGALACFRRCLRLTPDSIEALAGLAIVHETRKQWPAALEFRTRVVEVAGALSRSDPASLQRTIRYAAALARVERWTEAGVHFRRCVRDGAFQVLPQERPVLLRVFTQELYAPAMLAIMLSHGSVPAESCGAEAIAGLEEARALAELADLTAKDPQLPSWRRELLLGICALEAGDPERAFLHLDHADTLCADDVAINCLLMRSAEATLSPERDSIAKFAVEVALRTQARAQHGFAVDESNLFYAAQILSHAVRGGAASRESTGPTHSCDNMPQPARLSSSAK